MILNFLKYKIYHLKINCIKTLKFLKNKTKHRSLTLKKKTGSKITVNSIRKVLLSF